MSIRNFISCFLCGVVLVQNAVLAHALETNLWPATPLKATVLHIQDIHRNTEAQLDISRLIKDAVSNRPIGFIALEGAFAPIRMNAFRTYSDQLTIRDVADYYLGEKQMTGAIHAALTSDTSIPPVIGIDDERHYHANVAAYRDAIAQAPAIKKVLQARRQDIERQKEKEFNSSLAAFDASVEAYRSGNLPLNIYLKRIAKTGIELSPALRHFVQVAEWEGSLDQQKIERDRTRLLSKLTSRLNAADIRNLTEAGVSYWMGRLPHTSFYRLIDNLCAQNRVSLAGFPSMKDYLNYLFAADRIEVGRVLSEMKTAEKAAFARLARTKTEARLIETSQWIYLTEKLVGFSLTKDEWEEYKLARHPGGSRDPVPRDAFKAAYILDPGFRRGDDSFERFYEEAELRDEEMASNLIDQLKSSKTRSAVLVTGGFHSNGIHRRLAEAGINVISVVPKITKVETDDGSSYLSVFAREKAPLDSLFAGEKLFLSELQTESLAPTALVTAGFAADPQKAAGELLGRNPFRAGKKKILKDGWSLTWKNIRSDVSTAFEISRSPKRLTRVTVSSIASRRTSITGAVVAFALVWAPIINPTEFLAATRPAIARWLMSKRRGRDPVNPLPGSTVEASSGISEQGVPRSLEFVRKSHFSSEFQNPLFTVATLVRSPSGGVLLVKKKDENFWTLLEQESVIGEDELDTASRSVTPWISSDDVYRSHRTGFVSNPDRVKHAYAYTVLVETTLKNAKPKIRVAKGYEKAKFFSEYEIASLSVHPSHRSILQTMLIPTAPGFTATVDLQHARKGNRAKLAATKKRHQELSSQNQTQPLVSVQAIAELYHHGNFEGVLLVKRKDNGLWDTPGGHPNAGETAEKGALRELREETNLTGTAIRLFDITGRKNSSTPVSSFRSLFYVVQTSGKLILDKVEIEDHTVVHTLQELKMIAQSRSIAWDNYTMLVRYFIEKEKKPFPQAVADPWLLSETQLLIKKTILPLPFTFAQKQFIQQAFGILLAEVEENHKGYAWGFDPTGDQFGLMSPLHVFLKNHLQEANALDADLNHAAGFESETLGQWADLLMATLTDKKNIPASAELRERLKLGLQKILFVSHFPIPSKPAPKPPAGGNKFQTVVDELRPELKISDVTAGRLVKEMTYENRFERFINEKELIDRMKNTVVDQTTGQPVPKTQWELIAHRLFHFGFMSNGNGVAELCLIVPALLYFGQKSSVTNAVFTIALGFLLFFVFRVHAGSNSFNAGDENREPVIDIAIKKGKDNRELQDAFVNQTLSLPIKNGKGRLLAVLDGNGRKGHQVAQFIADRLPLVMEEMLHRFQGDVIEALREMPVQLKLDLLSRRDNIADFSATSLAMIYIPEMDSSRLGMGYVLGLRDSTIITLNRDTIVRANNKNKISIGGFGFEQTKSSPPEIYSVPLGPSSVVVLATDGVVAPLGAIVRGLTAQQLVDESQTGDDATAVVWRFATPVKSPPLFPIIRPVVQHQHDLPNIFDLEDDTIYPEQGEDLLDKDRIMNHPFMFNLEVADYVGNIIGYMLFKHGRESLFLSKLAVAAHYQRRSVGRQFIESLHRKLIGPLTQIVAVVNEYNLTAQRFLVKLGFKFVPFDNGFYVQKGKVRLLLKRGGLAKPNLMSMAPLALLLPWTTDSVSPLVMIVIGIVIFVAVLGMAPILTELISFPRDANPPAHFLGERLIERTMSEYAQRWDRWRPERSLSSETLLEESNKLKITVRRIGYNAERLDKALELFARAAIDAAEDPLIAGRVRSYIAESPLSEQTRRNLPNFAQVEAALYLQNSKSLVHMLPSEGKTLAIALATYLKTMRGFKAEVHPSGNILPARDAQMAGAILSRLGVRVGAVVNDVPYFYSNGSVSNGQFPHLTPVKYKGPKATRALLHECDVIYGSYDRMIFLWMSDWLYVSFPYHAWNHRYWIFVDEADVPWFDSLKEPLALFKQTMKMADSRLKTYSVIFKFAKECSEMKPLPFSLSNEQLTIDPARYADLMNQLNTELKKELNGEHEFINELDIPDLFHAALESLHLFIPDEHYFVQKDAVVIRDEITNETKSDRRWARGIHTFLEMKEGVTIRSETIITSLMTTYDFYSRFSRFSGVMGSVLDTSVNDYLVDRYRLEVHPIHPLHLNRRVELEPRYFLHESEKIDYIVKTVKLVAQSGRPILLNTRTPKEADKFAELLKENTVRAITGRNPDDELTHWNRMGEENSITIASQIAGRGHEIKLENHLYEFKRVDGYPEPIAGLFIISTDHGSTEAVEQQLKTRAGRGGRPGLVQICAHVKDNPLLKQYVAAELADLLKKPFDPDSPKIKSLFYEARARRLKRWFDHYDRIGVYYSNLIEANVRLEKFSTEAKIRGTRRTSLRSQMQNFVNKAFEELQKGHIDVFTDLFNEFVSEMNLVRKSETVPSGTAVTPIPESNRRLYLLPELRVFLSQLSEPEQLRVHSSAMDAKGNQKTILETLLNAVQKNTAYAALKEEEKSALDYEIGLLGTLSSRKAIDLFLQLSNAKRTPTTVENAIIHGLPFRNALERLRKYSYLLTDHQKIEFARIYPTYSSKKKFNPAAKDLYSIGKIVFDLFHSRHSISQKLLFESHGLAVELPLWENHLPEHVRQKLQSGKDLTISDAEILTDTYGRVFNTTPTEDFDELSSTNSPITLNLLVNLHRLIPHLRPKARQIISTLFATFVRGQLSKELSEKLQPLWNKHREKAEHETPALSKPAVLFGPWRGSYERALPADVLAKFETSLPDLKDKNALWSSDQLELIKSISTVLAKPIPGIKHNRGQHRRLRSIRENVFGFTERQLAAALEVDIEQYLSWEKGEYIPTAYAELLASFAWSYHRILPGETLRALRFDPDDLYFPDLSVEPSKNGKPISPSSLISKFMATIVLSGVLEHTPIKIGVGNGNYTNAVSASVSPFRLTNPLRKLSRERQIRSQA